MDDATQLSERINLKCPPVLIRAVDQAAGDQLQSRSQYVRDALLARLRADGYDPTGPR